MRQELSAQQLAFYTKNGYIELEVPHKAIEQTEKRDQWRDDSDLLRFFQKKLGPLALELSGKKHLRLGFSEWIGKNNKPARACTLKEMLSLQGHEICAAISNTPIEPNKKSPLGLLPQPQAADNVLFFRSNLILDWPHVPSEVLLVVFALQNAVYIENKKDPNTHYLKELGYFFGDQLKNSTHPII